MLKQIIKDQRHIPEQTGILRKFIDQLSVSENKKAYKGLTINRPNMDKNRQEKLQTLLKNLKGKSGSKRRKLIPQLNTFTRNMNEFKNKTHNILKGDALLSQQQQADLRSRMEIAKKQNELVSEYLHELWVKTESKSANNPYPTNKQVQLVAQQYSARDTVVTKSMQEMSYPSITKLP